MSRIRLWSIAWLAALATWLGSSTADATVMVELGLEDMVRDADVIVIGTVERSGVQMVLSQDTMEPFTVTRIRVSRWLKGGGDAESDVVSVHELGGVHNDGGMWIAGTPEYRVGEEVVLFLERRVDHPEWLRTYGMAQGKFMIVRGAPGVPTSVQRDLEAISFARWAGGQMTVEPARTGPAMALEPFLLLIRQTLALGRAR